MKVKKKWALAEVMPVAERLYKEFAPHCEQIAVVGSVRRQEPLVSDIDLIIIPKRPFFWGVVLKNGIAEAVDKYTKVVGDMTEKSKYVRRKTPEGIEVDLWICNERNWGLAINIKTGPVNYNVSTILRGLETQGYAMFENHVIRKSTGDVIPVRNETDLYKLINIPYKKPEDRR